MELMSNTGKEQSMKKTGFVVNTLTTAN